MVTQLTQRQLPAIRYLVDDVRVEKALIAVTLTGAAKAAVFVDNAKSPSIVLFAYGNDAIILGVPMNIHDVGAFITEVHAKYHRRRFSSITCATQDWRDSLLNVPGFRFGVTERNAYRLGSHIAAELPGSGKDSVKGFTIRKIDYELAKMISRNSKGDFHDFRSAWESPDEFVAGGQGYCLWKDNEIASIAFSYFPVTEFLEIGIATKERFRKQGLAGIVGLRLIEDCVSHGIEPLWSCFSSNKASNELAKKLGFKYDRTYYWLCEESSKVRSLLGGNRLFRWLATLIANRRVAGG